MKTTELTSRERTATGRERRGMEESEGDGMSLGGSQKVMRDRPVVTTGDRASEKEKERV